MARPQLRPEAEEDATAAARWYNQQVPGLGEDFLEEVERGLSVIAESPNLWPIWPKTDEALAVRRFLLHRFPYGLAYINGPVGPLVIAVVQLQRRPGYWLERVRKPRHRGKRR